MEVQANYIKRIEIHGLWHRYDIAWDLSLIHISEPTRH
mgnify:CR=1 FL=1